MNFLALVQRVQKKCRPSGSLLSTTTGALPAEPQRFVDWTNEAWMEIQNERPDWRWMRKSVSFQTVNNKALYTLAQIGVTDFGTWNRESFRSYNTVAGTDTEQFMNYMAYDQWRDLYQFAAFRKDAQWPLWFTCAPDDSLGLGPVPSADYTVTGDYYAVASEMVGNAAVPGLPTQWHMAIVYKAAMLYGASEAATEVYQDAQTNFNRIMADVRNREMIELEIGGPLV